MYNCIKFAYSVTSTKKYLLWQDYGVFILPQTPFFYILWQNKSCYGTDKMTRKGKTSLLACKIRLKPNLPWFVEYPMFGFEK